GEERGYSPVAAKEQLALSPSFRATPPEVIARQAIGDIVVPERLRPRIEAGDALLAANPESAICILENPHQIVARQTIDFRVARECSVLAVEPVQPQPRRQPERSAPVFVNRSDAASLEAVKGTPAGCVIHE